MTRKNTLADDICVHVGRFNIFDWLQNVGEYFALPPDELTPTPPPLTDHCIEIPKAGLSLTLKHPHAAHVTVADPDRWILTSAEFTPPWADDSIGRGALPFGLYPVQERPASIGGKLGNHRTTELDDRDNAKGDRRQSYFLSNELVVGIT